MEQGKYKKRCPWGNHIFYSNSRNQKYCSHEHGKLYTERHKAQKIRYEEIAPVERVRVAAHALAKKVMDLLVELGLKKRVCTANGCGEVENLEVHHHDLNWLNNTPKNIDFYCIKHHKVEHSKLQKRLNEEGIVMDEYYALDFLPLARIINKDKD